MPPRTSRSIMFDKLGWVTVQQLIAYHTLITVFRIRLTKEPEDLATILSKDNISGHIIMKNMQLGLYRESFVFRGAVLWNIMPLSLRKATKLGVFKKNIKQWVENIIPRFPN